MLFYLLRDRGTPLLRCSNSSCSISLFLEPSFFSQLIFFCFPSGSSDWWASWISWGSNRSFFNLFFLLPTGTSLGVGSSGAGSHIIIPLSARLAAQRAKGATGVMVMSTTLMGSGTMTETSSSAFEEEDFSASFSCFFFFPLEWEKGFFLFLSSFSYLTQKV